MRIALSGWKGSSDAIKTCVSLQESNVVDCAPNYPESHAVLRELQPLDLDLRVTTKAGLVRQTVGLSVEANRHRLSAGIRARMELSARELGRTPESTLLHCADRITDIAEVGRCLNELCSGRDEAMTARVGVSLWRLPPAELVTCLLDAVDTGKLQVVMIPVRLGKASEALAWRSLATAMRAIFPDIEVRSMSAVSGGEGLKVGPAVIRGLGAQSAVEACLKFPYLLVRPDYVVVRTGSCKHVSELVTAANLASRDENRQIEDYVIRILSTA